MYGLLVRRSHFIFLSVIFLLTSVFACGQAKSENGWALPTEGTLRVLMVFVEVDHDVDSSVDAYPKGHKNWKVNQLPEYRDEIFNVFSGEDSLKKMTRYYNECSFGEFTVLGDYYPEIITVKQSEVGRNKSKILRTVADRLNAAEQLSSQSLGLDDFDYWQDESKRGMPKVASSKFSGVDHLMIFLRNFEVFPSGNGQASGSSGGKIGGFNTDSYSMFSGGEGMPFGILKHEFNHLLIGGNNFHSGGGNSARFRSYVLSVQGGWSMMGAAHSSLLSAAGWDRYWLGWKPQANDFEISAKDVNGAEVNGDLIATENKRTFILRDFVNTGDALRIKLPFIPEDDFPQWIWVENHTTYTHNGSPTDRFLYEHYDCMSEALPGLYVTRQIDANVREGKEVYSQVYADYLKPITATGAYDYVWGNEEVQLESCVNGKPYYPYSLVAEHENPLTGHHELEDPFYYTNADSEITAENMRSLGLRRNKDGTYYRHPRAGDPNYAMRQDGVGFIGIGTNPATASTLTHVNTRKGKSSNSQNSNDIYLNGISIKILETLPDLSLKVEVSFCDTLMNESRRWAGADIFLNDHNLRGVDLYVQSILSLDRGKTITRFVEPDTVEGDTYFSSPTVLRIKKGAKMTIEKEVRLLKDSKIIVEEGGELELLRKSQVVLEDAAEIIFENGSSLSGKGKIKFSGSSKGIVDNAENFKKVKRRTCQNKRIKLEPSATKL